MPENILTNFQYSRQQQRYSELSGVTPTIFSGSTSAFTETDQMVLGNFRETDILNAEMFVNANEKRVFMRAGNSILEFITSGGTLDNVSTTGGTWNDVTNNLLFTKSDGNTYNVDIDSFSGLTVNGILSATTLNSDIILSGGTNLLDIFATSTDVSGKWDAQSGTYKKVALWSPDGNTLGDSQLEDWGVGSGRGIGLGDVALPNIAIHVADNTWDYGIDCRISESSGNYAYGAWIGMSKPSGLRGYGVIGQSVTELGGTNNISVGVYGHAEGSSTYIPLGITSVGGNFQAGYNIYNTGDTAAVVAYNSFSDHANDNYGIIVEAENQGTGSSYIGRFDDDRTTGVGKYLKCIAADGTAEWATVTDSGEVNTASNVGAGTGIFAQKSGVDLEFKTITSTGSTVTITSDSTTVNVEADFVQDYDPRVTSTASTATLTVDSSSTDQSILTAQAAALTIAAPTGTPVQGRKLILRIKDNGTARAITWNAIFRTMGTTLPTTTVISKTVYIGCVYNSTDTKWDVVAVAQEA